MEPHYLAAQIHLTDAGRSLAKHLHDNPHAIDDLTELEKAVVTFACGKAPITVAERRADQLDRLEREAERANRPDERIEHYAMGVQSHELPKTKFPPVSDEEDRFGVVGVMNPSLEDDDIEGENAA